MPLNFATVLGQAVPMLPAAPLFRRLLLEEPGTLTAVLVVAAIVGFYLFNRSGKTREAFWWALVVLVAAAGVQTAARSIQTDREAILEATKELVRVTSRADTAALEPMLASDVRLSNDFNLARSEAQFDSDKAQILADVRTYLKDRFPLKECAILDTQGVIDRDGYGRTQVRIRAVPEALGFPNISWWRIDWQRQPDGSWLVRGIQPVDLGLKGF